MRRLTELLGLSLLLVCVSASGAETPLADGAAIPSAKLVTHTGQTIEVGKYAAQQGKRNLLLLFFRTGNCGICVGQLRDVAEHFEQVTADKAAVLAISLDDAITHAATFEKIERKYPLLLDPEGKTIHAFGVYNPEDKLARPAVYLISSAGKVLYHYVGKSLTDRPTIQEVLDVLHHYSGGLPTSTGRSASRKANR